ncbi:TetR/AcrR family transcriptional regulator [Dickeya sp. NCPPB 3274]|uniref:TetR/AcrR family transcriptional regulator n=1 Tax=Dickeya sp. NCPPB 3274 TaxID=568766 RepID=UPI00039E9F33|nr:TetR/AcrR family transcriptional regulator [Dickeya sp. NCPPB 3274]
MKNESGNALKETILDAAIALFKEKGVTAVKTRDVTDFLGISRSHIYHYFSDWNALRIAAFLRFMRMDLDEITARVGALPPDARLPALIDHYLPESVDAAWVLYSDIWKYAMHDQIFAGMITALITEWDQLMAQVIRDGIAAGLYKPVEASRVARQLGAVVNGYADVLTLHPDPVRRAGALDDIQVLVRVLLQ